MEHFPLACRDNPVKLRQTYLRLALAYHPDKVVGTNAVGTNIDELLATATATFQAIQAAYDVLSSKEHVSFSTPQWAQAAPRIRSALAAACELGDCRTVADLLRLKPWSVNEADNHGVTPLMFAARGASVEVCKLLLGAAANLDAQNPLGWTALTYASLQGCVEVARYLIGQGAQILDNDLVCTSFTGVWGTFKVLLEYCGGIERVLAVRDNKGKGLLHFSLTGLAYLKHSSADHFRCVELAIDARCDPGAEDQHAALLRNAACRADCRTAEKDFATPCAVTFQVDQGVPLLFHLVHSMTLDWASLGLDESAVHLHAIRRLCSLKADPWSRGPDGRHAVDVARDGGLQKVGETLVAWQSLALTDEPRWKEHDFAIVPVDERGVLAMDKSLQAGRKKGRLDSFLLWMKPVASICSTVCLDPHRLSS